MPSFPPGAPTIAGNVISVDAFLNNPPLVQRVIADLTNERFLADRVFRAGPATSAGSLLYDQVTASELYTDRDVQKIEPGSEFPLVTAGPTPPKVAVIEKWGGAFEVTDEDRDRNRYDRVARNLTRLRNTIVKKADVVALAALAAAPVNTQAASGDWTTAATDVIGDVNTAKNALDALDMGYVADLALINPAQALDIRNDADIRSALPREGLQNNLLNNPAPDLDGVLGLTWYVTNRVAAGTVWILDSSNVGGISEEQPLTSEVVPERKRQTTRVQAWRKFVPFVTDPKAAVKITGA